MFSKRVRGGYSQGKRNAVECSRRRASLSKGPMAGRPSSPESRVRELHLRVREEGQGEERDREVRWVEGESKREKQA